MGSPTTDGGFEHIKIAVVPHIPTPTMVPSGAFEPTAPGSPEYGMGGVEPVPGGLVTEEDVMRMVKLALVTTPNMFKRPWLATPDEDLKPFVAELTIYFNAHDINPNDYFGDWLPMAVTGMVVGAGILERHRDHKKEHTEEKKKDFDSSTIVQEDHTPVEKKLAVRDESSGTNLPEEEDAGGDVGGEEDI